jgi:hypothetical protein
VTGWSPYPRIAHLIGGRGTKDDRTLETVQLDQLMAKEVVVEEKLDGANVVLWATDHRVECALRSGPGGIDRAGQLGPLRAWVAERTGRLRELLADGCVLYAEWLYIVHTVHYVSLPSYLVALDLRLPDCSFLAPDARTEACRAVGLPVPPELWRGVPGRVATLEALLGQSRWGPETAEGIVIRTVDGTEPRIAKLLRSGFNPLKDDDWKRSRPHNTLADREASWH